MGLGIALNFGTAILLRVIFSMEKAVSKPECLLIVFNSRFRSFLEILFFKKRKSSSLFNKNGTFNQKPKNLSYLC